MGGDQAAVGTAPAPPAPEGGPAEPRADSITRNTFYGLATQMTTAAFTAALTLFLVRALGPGDYGVFALATGIGTLLVLVADFGLSGSAGRFAAERRHDPHDVAGVTWEAVVLKGLFATPLCIALVLLAQPIANAYDSPELVWPLRAMAVVVLGQGMFLFLRGVFASVGRVSLTWQVTLLESAFEFLASITLVAASATATAASFGRAAGYVLGAMTAAVLMMRFLGKQAMAGRTSGHMRSMTGYAGALFVVTVAYTLFEQLGVIIVGAVEGTEAAGIFEAPTRLTTFLSYGGMAVALGVAPRLARGREGPNVDAFLRSMRYLTILQAALLPPLLAWSTPIVDLTLGSGYEESADVLRALTPFVFLSGIGTFVTLVVNYVGEARRRVPLAVLSAVLVAGLNLALLPSMGVVGAAVAMDIAFAVYTLGHIWICHKTIDVPFGPLMSSFGRCLVAAGLATIALAAFGTDSLSVFDWVLGTLAGLVVFVAALFATRETTPAEARALWRGIRSRVPLPGRVRRLAPDRGAQSLGGGPGTRRAQSAGRPGKPSPGSGDRRRRSRRPRAVRAAAPLRPAARGACRQRCSRTCAPPPPRDRRGRRTDTRSTRRGGPSPARPPHATRAARRRAPRRLRPGSDAGVSACASRPPNRRRRAGGARSSPSAPARSRAGRRSSDRSRARTSGARSRCSRSAHTRSLGARAARGSVPPARSPSDRHRRRSPPAPVRRAEP